MPSHKMLNSVVHSVIDSFTSLMNYLGNDYIIGQIVSNSWKTESDTIEIDFINKKYTKNHLLNESIEKSIMSYINTFEDLVNRSNSSTTFIVEAKMVIFVNGKIKIPITDGRLFESPYKCSMEIVDDKGKKYFHEKSGTWYPEN